MFRPQFGVAEELTLLHVVKDSPAEAAGLLPGDKLAKVNGAALGSGKRASRTLERALGESDAASVTLTINRNGVLSEREVQNSVGSSGGAILVLNGPTGT